MIEHLCTCEYFSQNKIDKDKGNHGHLAYSS